MAHYIIARRPNDVFEVTRFSDNDIPDHTGILDYAKGTLNFNFYHKVTQSTLDKYMLMATQFIKDGEPECTVYFVTEEPPFKVSSYSYGSSIPKEIEQKKKPRGRKIAKRTVVAKK